nr:hypothetical protein [Chthonobacter albigriseus]
MAGGLHARNANPGHIDIACIYMDGDEIDARLWEISENLHRAELTALERDEQVAEWVRLTNEKVAQSAPPGGAQPAAKGLRAAQRELGIERTDASRATKVASLTPEAKAVAREVGLDDNRSALLSAARAEPGKQAAVIRQIAERKVVLRRRTYMKRAACPFNLVPRTTRRHGSRLASVSKPAESRASLSYEGESHPEASAPSAP